MNTIRTYKNETVTVKIGDVVRIYLGLGQYSISTIVNILGEQDRLSCLYIETEDGYTLPSNAIVEVVREA